MGEKSYFGRIKEQFFDIKKEEWPRALALSFFFFLVIAVFWVLKPIKKGALISFYKEDPLLLFGFTFGGAEVEQLAKVVNMIVVFGVVVLFTLLIRRFKRQQVVYIFCGVISILLVYFGFIIVNPGAFDAWSFYVFGDIFNSVMVATFWAFANDVNSPQESKRLYGIIGLGGVVGGFFGATFVSALVDVKGAKELMASSFAELNLAEQIQSGFIQFVFPVYEQILAFSGWLNQQFGFTGLEDEALGRQGLLLLCIFAMATIAVLAWFVNSRASDAEEIEKEEAEKEGKEKSVNAALEGAKLVFNSKYLLAILGIIGFYEIISNIIEFQLSASVETSSMQGTEIDSFFGVYGLLIGLVSISVQLFATPYVMNKKSVGAALLILPVLDFVLSIGFLAVPVLWIAAALSINDNALYYSITQSAKESLYTPTSRDAKYKAKAFIDMFGQRAAKVFAVVLNLVVAAYVGIENVRWLSIATLMVIVAYFFVVRYAGKEFKNKASEGES
jgi:AAA family ATP:ADP antiporter